MISRFSYKSRKDEDKNSSKSEAEEFKVTVATNVKRNIVSSAEVITRNDNNFNGGRPNKEVGSTKNAIAVIKSKSNSKPKQTKISSFFNKNN